MAGRRPISIHPSRTIRVAQEPRIDSGYVPYENALYYRNNEDENIDTSKRRSIYPPEPLPPTPPLSRRGRSLSPGSSRSSSSSPGRTPSRSRRSRQRPSGRHNHSPNRNPTERRNQGRNQSLSPPRHSPRRDPSRPANSYTALKAAKCAALGAGLEAFRARNEPGPWLGRKGKRCAIAAASGVAVGSLRQGSMPSSGWAPYAEAICTGFFAVEWYKKIGRDTHHEENALKEQEGWRREAKRNRDDGKR